MLYTNLLFPVCWVQAVSLSPCEHIPWLSTCGALLCWCSALRGPHRGIAPCTERTVRSWADGQGLGPAGASGFCAWGAEPCQHLHLGHSVSPPHTSMTIFSAALSPACSSSDFMEQAKPLPICSWIISGAEQSSSGEVFVDRQPPSHQPYPVISASALN